MIIQSTISDTGLRGMPKDDAAQWTEIYLSRLGLKPKDADQLAAIPADKLIDALSGTGRGAETARDAATGQVGSDFANRGDISTRFVPVVDGKTMADPFDSAAPEISANIPLMVSSVKLNLFLTRRPKIPTGRQLIWTTPGCINM